MLNASELKGIIINSISQKKDAKQIHNLLAGIINSYLIQNLEIQGNYIGVTPLGSPDPMNGPVKFRLIICSVLGQKLLELAKQDMNSWYKGLLINIQLTSILSPRGDKVTLIAPSLAFMSISNSQINIKGKTLQESWLKITDSLVNDIKTASPTPAPLPAVGTGTGVVKLTKFN